MHDTHAGPAGAARLLRELQDLKRLRPAHLSYSIATEQFRRGWRGLIAGRDAEGLALTTTLACLLSVLFPGVDERFFAAARLDQDAAVDILRRALDRTAGDQLAEPLLRALHRVLPDYVEDLFSESGDHPRLPEPLEVLCRQPRAGATHPEHPRLVLEPPEMHSDHCLLTAVYAVCYADGYGSDYATPWIAGMAHHLHNAYLPDCGYAGEICLGDRLESVIENCRNAAIAWLPNEVRDPVREALGHHESLDAPAGRAISAGDVLDRVLDVQWRTRAAAVTNQEILGELDLVHPGPLKEFQTDLLASTGLWTA